MESLLINGEEFINYVIPSTVIIERNQNYENSFEFVINVPILTDVRVGMLVSLVNDFSNLVYRGLIKNISRSPIHLGQVVSL